MGRSQAFVSAALLCAAATLSSLSGCGTSGRHVTTTGQDAGGTGNAGDASTSNTSGDGGTATNPGNPDIGMTSVDPNGPDDTCSNQTFTPTKVGDPDIILIQDTSGSMSDGMPTSKYDRVIGALTSVITTLDQNMSPVEWGLVIFPTDDNCAVDPTPPVTVGTNKGPDVIAAIQAHSPNGNTPLATAVMVATNYYATLNDGRAHYLLVATDGEPNCDTGSTGLPMTCMKDSDCPTGQTCMTIPIMIPNFPISGVCTAPATGGEASMAIAAALTKGIKTYVVGIDLGGDSATLDDLATNGGTARAMSPKYYPVTDQTSLQDALTNITSQVISCSFALQALPLPNVSIEVTAGGATVHRDTTHMNGWDLDPTTKTLTFYGAACTSLQANPTGVNVGYTCPPPG